MTDQYTKDFFASLPQDKVTTWAEGERPQLKDGGEVYAYLPHSDWPVRYIPLILRSDGKCGVSAITLKQPAPRTLEGKLYQGWCKSKQDRLVEVCFHYTESVEEALSLIRHKESLICYGYREIDAETGATGPFIIVGGSDE